MQIMKEKAPEEKPSVFEPLLLIFRFGKIS